MFSVHITERDADGKAAHETQLEFSQEEISIGRAPGNDILLPKSNISKRHARILRNKSGFVVVDAKSTNGTYVNGRRLDSPYDLSKGDKIYIGDFVLEVGQALAHLGDDSTSGSVSHKGPPKPARKGQKAKKKGKGSSSSSSSSSSDRTGTHSKVTASKITSSAVVAKNGGAASKDHAALHKPTERGSGAHEILARNAQSMPSRILGGDVHAPLDLEQAQREVHERLLKNLDLRRLDVASMSDAELRERTERKVKDIVADMVKDRQLPAGVEPDALVERVLNEALGLGPLESLLQDTSVSEILVNHAGQIFVERQGRLELTDKTFSSDEAVRGVIERIVAPLGRRIDESSPMVDARLKDGSRVNAVIPPLSLRGPTLTIRKFASHAMSVDALVAGGTLTKGMATFLRTCVLARRNILVSGGTGSGKTTSLNVLSSFIPEAERIITIEDAAELKLDQAHVVALETRPPNIEGQGAVTIRDLVRNALRMRPDRIVVGECRGGEALDMLQAMNTGHDGSLTTVHANGPRDALARLETMVLMSGLDLPVRAIRDQVASAVNIVVHQNRFSDGSRRLTHISEITGLEGDVITMQDIFVFEPQGVDHHGHMQGRFRPTGFVPTFYQHLGAMGIEADLSVFQEG